MAIVKEDGTGLVNATVYADEADLDAYALSRNEDLSGYSTVQKEASLLISAQDWIDGQHEFGGYLVNDDQGLKMPTSTVELPNKDIVKVNCNTAILQLKGLLFATPTSSSGTVKRVKKKLDVLETETEFFEDGDSADIDTSVADNLLRPYTDYSVGSTGSNFRVW